METNFNFKSQPATSIEQSKRLLSLGLKKETADMALVPLMEWDDCTSQEYFTGIYVTRTKEDVERYNLDYIHAWSLGRLLEVMRMKASSQIVPLDDTFDRLIEGIETRIKEGYFNKDFLV